MIKKLPLAALVLVIGFGLLAGCAGMKSYPTGLRADHAHRFYPAMKAVAQEHELNFADHAKSFNVQTKEGDWIQYMVQGDVINMVVVPEVEGLSKPQIAERQSELKKFGDQLLAEAKIKAEAAKAFEAN